MRIWRTFVTLSICLLVSHTGTAETRYYTVDVVPVDLGPVETWTSLIDTGFFTDFNDLGQVLGIRGLHESGGGDYSSVPFLWDPENGLNVPFNDFVSDFEGEFRMATGLNGAGQIVGYFSNGDGNPDQYFLWDPTSGLVDLGALGNFNGANRFVINDNGIVATNIDSVAAYFDPKHLWRWNWQTEVPPGGGTPLDYLPPGTHSHPFDINRDGNLVGWAEESGFLNAQPCVWLESGGGALVRLQAPEPPIPYEAQPVWAWAINDANRVVGWAEYYDPDGVALPFLTAVLWEEADGAFTPTVLPCLEGFDCGALDITDSSPVQVLGGVTDTESSLELGVWEEHNGVFEGPEAIALVNNAQGVILLDMALFNLLAENLVTTYNGLLSKINDRGQILTYGWLPTEGEDDKLAAVVLTPYGDNEDPVADFSLDPVEGYVPLDVDFTDLSSGRISAWLWDFGDGTTSTEQHPSHVYTTYGKYTVSLTVIGVTGGVSDMLIFEKVIDISLPSAGFNLSPKKGDAPLSVEFTNTSQGGEALTWLWNFGDGTTSSEEHPTHVYSSPGTYSVTLTAVDIGGGAKTKVRQGKVQAYDPSARTGRPEVIDRR